MKRLQMTHGSNHDIVKKSSVTLSLRLCSGFYPKLKQIRIVNNFFHL